MGRSCSRPHPRQATGTHSSGVGTHPLACMPFPVDDDIRPWSDIRGLLTYSPDDDCSTLLGEHVQPCRQASLTREADLPRILVERVDGYFGALLSARQVLHFAARWGRPATQVLRLERPRRSLLARVRSAPRRTVAFSEGVQMVWTYLSVSYKTPLACVGHDVLLLVRTELARHSPTGQQRRPAAHAQPASCRPRSRRPPRPAPSRTCASRRPSRTPRQRASR